MALRRASSPRTSVFPATAHSTNFPYSFNIRGTDPGRNSNSLTPTIRIWNKKRSDWTIASTPQKIDSSIFCRTNLAVYRINILCDNYRLSLPAATPPHVWAVGWACHFCTINGPTGSGNRQLSDKIMTLYLPIYIHTHIALNLIPTASTWQIKSKSYSMPTLPPSYAGSVDILGASSSWSSKGLYRPLQGRFACLLNDVHTAWHPI